MLIDALRISNEILFMHQLLRDPLCGYNWKHCILIEHLMAGVLFQFQKIAVIRP